MDFFNKLGKKTTEAYQTAKDKTTKLSGELKLKSKISDCKEKINQKYQEIGKMVYDKMKAGEDASKEDILPKCEDIEKLNEEIARAEVQILALKDIKKCTECGTELSAKAEFCSKCGSKQAVVEETKVVVEETSEKAEKAEDAEVTEIADVEDKK